MSATWCSSTHRARASAASPARTRRRRSSASIQDAYAFAEFITQFLSKYGRWNSPKYLFGESYGTPRSAVLINQLESGPLDRFQRRHSAVADSELRSEPRPARRAIPASICPTRPCCPPTRRPPGTTTSCRATIRNLEAFLTEVEQFAMGDYARALAAGSDLSATERGADRRKTAPIHRAAGRLHSQGGSAHRRRRVSPDLARRRGYDHRPTRIRASPGPTSIP